MPPRDEVVITGVGLLTPIGIGLEAFWKSIQEKRSGVARIESFDPQFLPVRIAAEVTDFEGKAYVRPRKSLKLMSRDSQFAVTTAGFAFEDSQLKTEDIDPERIGTVYGADIIRLHTSEFWQGFDTAIVDDKFSMDKFASEGIYEGYPLNFLKNLPNGLACHVSIIHDTRGPNNTMQDGEVSSLLAIMEASYYIERGSADIMFAGGASSRLHPLDWVRCLKFEQLAQDEEHPEQHPKPFDANRSGTVRGEGGASFMLEKRSHAEARNAKIYARILGSASGWGNDGLGLKHAINKALQDAGIAASDLGHVNANGLGDSKLDAIEAKVLAETVGTVPTTSLKSYIGSLYSASGAVETAMSLCAFENDFVPPTLNYETPDPGCPINVIHGEALTGAKKTALVINHTHQGQAAAMVISAE